MKSRLVILSMLVFGMLLSTAGAGLAIDGLSGNPSAGSAQYPKAQPPATPPGEGVLGDQDSGTGNNVSPDDTTGGGNNPSDTNPGDTQPGRQVEAGAEKSGNLPFTGFAAIPILFGGLVLLGGGLVLRSRASEH